MKIIFLDVDGVLNSFQDRYSFDLETDYHFELLQKIVQETGAKIVLSSSWRIGLARHGESVLIDRLKEFGMNIISCTPVLNGCCRGDEIRKWLDDTEEDVERFVILDDESDMAEFKETHLIKTDSMVGLQENDVRKCIEMLNA